MYNLYSKVVVVSALLFSFSLNSHAATLYIDPGIVNLYRGDAVTASVRLMPDQETGECINTVDAVITYPDSIQPVDVSIGRSIFNVWVETPTINKENRTITFAGGITNGYCGRVQGDPGFTNIVADIIFRSPGLQIGASSNSNIAQIDFAVETTAYLNDGQGTKANLKTLGSTITLNENAGPGIVDNWRDVVREDNLPPEEFSISLVKDPITFSGRYYIVYSTTDKQTGVSHYEVMEEPASEFGKFTWGRTDAPWIRPEVDNIHELKDQSLNSTIRVKAFDKAGNEYVATLIPEESMRTISKNKIIFYSTLAVFGTILLSLILIITYIVRRRRKSLKTELENEVL